MYTAFYNLKEKPFALSPSPRFLYLGEVHKEALALLKYGISERKGFTLLTGEVGTGKTTMIHALLSGLDEETICVYVSNPFLSPREFFEYISFSVFKKKVGYRSKTDFLVEFESFLKKCLQHQKNFILIIDEAHKLSYELLEEIRLLSNMETADEKLMNIFLAGQPELNRKLRQPRCRALLQRISTRYHIKPLDLKSTQEYILKRMHLAGAENGQKIFSTDVIKKIYQYADGYPRLINILADNALLVGYARGTRKISPAMIKECYDDLQINDPDPGTSLPEYQSKKAEPGGSASLSTKIRKKVAIGFVLALILVAFIFLHGDTISERFFPYANPGHRVKSDMITKKRIVAKEIIEEKLSSEQESYLGRKDADLQPEIPEAKKKEAGEFRQTGIMNKDQLQSGTLFGKDIIVEKGQTLVELAMQVYGQADETILKRLQTHNPEIVDIDFIHEGQKIFFPMLTGAGKERSFTVHIASFVPFENARTLFLELIKKNYEAYLLPVQTDEKGKVFRITLGNFTSRQKAKTYADQILTEKAFEYARVMQLEMK